MNEPNLRNLTPHSILIMATYQEWGYDQGIALLRGVEPGKMPDWWTGGATRIPSVGNARVSQTVKHADEHRAFSVAEVEYGEIEGLPEPVEGWINVVSMVVLQALQAKGIYRPDCVAPSTGPGECVRDELGQIVAVRRLVRLAPKPKPRSRPLTPREEGQFGAFVDIVTDLAGREETMDPDEALTYLREWVASRHTTLARS